MADLQQLQKLQDQQFQSLQDRLLNIDKQKSGMKDFFSKAEPMVNQQLLGSRPTGSFSTPAYSDAFTNSLSNTRTLTDLNNERYSVLDSIQKALERQQDQEAKTIKDTSPKEIDPMEFIKLKIEANKIGQDLTMDEQGQPVLTPSQINEDPTAFVAKLKNGKKEIDEASSFIKSLSEIKNDLTAQGAKSGGIGTNIGSFFQGITGPIAQNLGFFQGKDKRDVRAKLQNFRTNVQKDKFGSVLTAQEIAQADKFLPGNNIQEYDNLSRIDAQLHDKVIALRQKLVSAGMSDNMIEQYITQLMGPQANTESTASQNPNVIQSPTGRTYEIIGEE